MVVVVVAYVVVVGCHLHIKANCGDALNGPTKYLKEEGDFKSLIDAEGTIVFISWRRMTLKRINRWWLGRYNYKFSPEAIL